MRVVVVLASIWTTTYQTCSLGGSSLPRLSNPLDGLILLVISCIWSAGRNATPPSRHLLVFVAQLSLISFAHPPIFELDLTWVERCRLLRLERSRLNCAACSLVARSSARLGIHGGLIAAQVGRRQRSKELCVVVLLTYHFV